MSTCLHRDGRDAAEMDHGDEKCTAAAGDAHGVGAEAAAHKAAEPATTTPRETRLALRRAGFAPLPIAGERPPMSCAGAPIRRVVISTWGVRLLAGTRKATC